MDIVAPLPIFSIKRPEDVFEHLCISKIAKQIGALDYSVSFLNQFFISHCVLAAAFCTRADNTLPKPMHITIYGDANNSSMSPLMLTPECGRDWMKYLYGQEQWPEIRSITSTALWFSNKNPFAAWRHGPEAHIPTPVHRLNDIPFNQRMDVLVHMPSNDIVETLALHLPQHAWAKCIDRSIPVRIIAASMTEALLVQEYARLHGYHLSAPSAIPIKTNINGEQALTPAGYVLTLVGQLPEQDEDQQEAFMRLSRVMQSDDGYFDDAMLIGTRTADGSGVHMFNSSYLDLDDGYLYESIPSHNDEEQWLKVAGPLDLENIELELPLTANPIQRWYWALSITENMEPLD